VKPSFLITIDTEGDNEWACPRQVSTRNALFLPRFQALCERFGFKPTWLTTHEMARCPTFVRLAREVLRRGAGEVGMHLHAWSSPPLIPLTHDDLATHPYLIEYPLDVMQAKIAALTDLLQQQFGVKMRSHRAGRWAFNRAYAALLAAQGYEVDCSITPHVSWAACPGAPGGPGGSDYRGFPQGPYFLDLHDLQRPGTSPLLELPPTIRPSRLQRWAPWVYQTRGLRRLAHRVSEPLTWLRPAPGNLPRLLALVEQVRQEAGPCLQFMLHSSELMPGGSPSFRTEADIEALYLDLNQLFATIARHWQGATLSGFRQSFAAQGFGAHATAFKPGHVAVGGGLP
jgi:hypothetical protein